MGTCSNVVTEGLSFRNEGMTSKRCHVLLATVMQLIDTQREMEFVVSAPRLPLDVPILVGNRYQIASMQGNLKRCTNRMVTS